MLQQEGILTPECSIFFFFFFFLFVEKELKFCHVMHLVLLKINEVSRINK